MQQAIDALLVSVPVPELATGRTYDFECQLKNDFALAAEQLVKSRTTLQRYKDHLLHATLLDNNQILEIRPLQLVATEQELPCIRIRYPVSIVSNIAFTAVDDDDALHCWLLSQNGLLVRHNLTDAFLKQPLENWTFTTPVESIANKHFVCMSVASSGVATIGCEDGTVVHVQDLERQSAPASSIHFHIVHQDEHFCEFQLRDSTTFGPLLMLQRMGSYVGWRLDSILEEPSSISRLSSLTSADVPLSKNSHAGLTAALRKDNRISLWSWTNSPQWSAAQVQRVVELPRFDADGTLIDPHDQDMTYQLPGSFQQAPLRSSKGFGSASFYNEEANLVRLLPHSAGRCKLLVYIEAENPFVAVYDIHLNRSGHIDLVMLTDTVTKPSRSRRQQHLDLSASLRKDGNQEALDIWIVSEEGSGLQIAHTSVPVHETGMKGAPVSHPVWRLAESKNESKSMSSTHSYVVQEKDVLVSTADTVFALRDLDVMEIAYYQSTVTGGNNSSYAARDNYPPYVPNSVLHMDSKQYQGVCYLFESIAPVIKELDQDIRREIIDTLGRYLGESGQQFAMQEIYNSVAKNISTLEDIESINEDAARTVLQSFSNKVECAQSVESGKVTEALTLSAVRDILQMRFDTISSLVLLLSHHIHKCGQNSLQSLAVSAIDTLRIYGALLWISENETSNEDDDDDKNNNASTYPASSTSILHFLVQKAYPITVKSERHLDIGSAAYSLISKLGAHDNDMLIDICAKLSSLGLISTALRLAQRYLDTSTEATSEKKGHKADVIHSITFREQLQHLKLKEASKTLQAVEEPDFQKRLAQELIDTAYAHADYQIICQLSPQSLRCQVDDLLLQRAENEKNTAALGKKSWWQICYSFYTFSGDHEQANKCMLKYLEKTGRQDSLLQNFFVQSE